jgi:Spy/CpxP family protein refolding chaperone
MKMFGFVIAAGSLAGLIYLSRHGRHGRGPRGYGMRWLFRRLDASPGQERVIRNALDEAYSIGTNLREQSRQAKPELAEILASGQFSEERVQSWLEARIGDFRTQLPKFTAEMAKVHEVLDDRQRRMLGDFLTRTPFYGHHRGHC